MKTILDRIVDGRTDLVFDYVAAGNLATAKDGDGVSLAQWCAYYGDVSAIRFLLSKGDSPLTWASWHLRPASVLRKLCFGEHRIHPHYAGMEANLLGQPAT